MNNYTGKIVFIGLDVHKKTYSIAAICDNELVKRATIKADHVTLLNFIRKYFPNASQINTAYESGFSGLGLHRFLIKNDINNIVVHAAAIEISSRDRVKTDKRDALKIATQLSAKRLKSIHILSPEQEAKRSISRYRETLAKDKTQAANRIKHFLHQYENSLLSEAKISITEKWIKHASNYEFEHKELTYTFRLILNQWLELHTKIKEVNKELCTQAKQDPLEEIYRSVPGIGPQAARVLSNELGDMAHFKSEKKLFSYTGLTPSEYSSGQHIRQGRISKQGNTSVRRILILSSWVAIGKDKSLQEIYSRIAQRSGGKRAIVAIARRLIGRIRSCLNTGSLYQLQTI